MRIFIRGHIKCCAEYSSIREEVKTAAVEKLMKDEGEKPIEPLFFFLTLVVAINSGHTLRD